MERKNLLNNKTMIFILFLLFPFLFVILILKEILLTIFLPKKIRNSLIEKKAAKIKAEFLQNKNILDQEVQNLKAQYLRDFSINQNLISKGNPLNINPIYKNYRYFCRMENRLEIPVTFLERFLYSPTTKVFHSLPGTFWLQNKKRALEFNYDFKDKFYVNFIKYSMQFLNIFSLICISFLLFPENTPYTYNLEIFSLKYSFNIFLSDICLIILLPVIILQGLSDIFFKSSLVNVAWDVPLQIIFFMSLFIKFEYDFFSTTLNFKNSPLLEFSKNWEIFGIVEKLPSILKIDPVEKTFLINFSENKTIFIKIYTFYFLITLVSFLWNFGIHYKGFVKQDVSSSTSKIHFEIYEQASIYFWNMFHVIGARLLKYLINIFGIVYICLGFSFICNLAYFIQHYDEILRVYYISLINQDLLYTIKNSSRIFFEEDFIKKTILKSSFNNWPWIIQEDSRIRFSFKRALVPLIVIGILRIWAYIYITNILEKWSYNQMIALNLDNPFFEEFPFITEDTKKRLLFNFIEEDFKRYETFLQKYFWEKKSVDFHELDEFSIF